MKKSDFYRFYCVIAICVIQYTMANAQTSFQSLNYLYGISGTKTVAGIHNREPNTDPDLWTDSITSVSGKTPGLWSGDFLFGSTDVAARWTMIYEAQEAWNKGSLINIMWHTCSPAYVEPCAWDATGVLDVLSDAEWTSLITDGGTLNATWKSRLDIIAPYLQYLEDNGVEVLFRPFHEMNQPVFWWGGRPGPTGTAKLYQITHDYLTINKGLSNLVWVWDLQDFSTYATDLVNYDPGSSYWDVLAMDMYNGDGTNYGITKYNAFVAAAGTKPVVIGECNKLPTSAELTAQPKWGFFMSWAENTVKNNSSANITVLYAALNVVTLDEMSGWVTSAPSAPSGLAASGGIGRIDLTWTDNSNNEGGFTADRSLDGSTWTTVYSNIDGNATSYSNSGLNAGTKYYYRLKSTNSFGSSTWSNTVNATTTAGVAVNVALSKTTTEYPGHTLTFVPSNAVDGSLTTRWVSTKTTWPCWIKVDLGSLYYICQIKINWDNAACATAYKVEISTDNINWTVVKDKSAGGGAGGTPETIDFTTQLAKYARLYIITPLKATNGIVIWEITVNAMTPFPPVASAAAAITSTGFNAQWNSVSNVTGYKLDVATDNAFANLVTGYNNLDVSNVTSYSVAGLNANTTYYYRVRAVNATLTSATNSNVISVATDYGTKISAFAGGNWNTPATWSPSGVPTASENVTITVDNPVIVDINPAVCHDLIINADATLTINAGNALTVNGTLTNSAGNSGLLVNSGGSLIENTSSVAATVYREITDATDDKWHLFISPVTTPLQASATSCFTGALIDKYIEASGEWERMQTNANVTPDCGYSINFLTGTRTLVFPGMLKTCPAAYSGLGYTSVSGHYPSGWNLVGNPYPCGINPALCSVPTGINAFAYVWNGVNYTTLSIGSDTYPGTIAALQGFFVRTFSAINSLTLDNNTKIHSGTFMKNGTSVPDMLKLKITGNGYMDETFIRFHEQATDGFDQQFDAYKLAGIDEAPQLYSIIPNEKAAVNTLPVLTSRKDVSLGLKVGKASTYEISAEGINSFDPEVSVFLEDLKLGTSLNLRTNAVYSFIASPGDIENRFILRIEGSTGIKEQGIRDVEVDALNGNIRINYSGLSTGNIYVFSAVGQLVANSAIHTGETLLHINASGMYMVKVITGKNSVTQKVVVTK